MTSPYYEQTTKPTGANCLFYLIIFLFPITTFSQILNGKILDHQTQEPLPYASIYINNSLRGTTSDEHGVFNLDITGLSGQDIVISYVGYKSEVLNKINPGKFYIIHLQQQSTLLEEIAIVAEPDDLSRKKMLKMFLNDFLGQTANAKKCVIVNLDDVMLSYSKSSRTLVAYSSVPLFIQNRSLGYSLTYFLEEFKRNDFHVSYRGYSIFKEYTTLTERELATVNKNRRKTYLGSRMEFFRMLWSGQLKGSLFDVVDANTGTRPDLVCDMEDTDRNLKSLRYTSPLKIIYNDSKVSTITFKDTKTIIFNANGYFDPSGHSWQGTMAIERVGDLLPFEYWPENEQ